MNQIIVLLIIEYWMNMYVDHKFTTMNMLTDVVNDK
jgi:hypothetical protein